MGNVTVKRTSALEGHYLLGHFGDHPDSNIIFDERKDLMLHQIAFWPETVDRIEPRLTGLVGKNSLPKPGKSIVEGEIALLRIEPLKIWIIGASPPQFKTDESVKLDISHSRTHLRVSGVDAKKLLNSYLPIDLRESSFPIGSVISSAFHHVGVTLWRTEAGYELFLPRGFALSLWELLLEGAAQFGYDVITNQ